LIDFTRNIRYILEMINEKSSDKIATNLLPFDFDFKPSVLTFPEICKSNEITKLTMDDFEKLQNLLQSNIKALATKQARDSIIQNTSIPRYLNKVEVIKYLGKEYVFNILCDEYGLKAIHKQHKGNLYCSRHVEDLCIRFENNL
jgi:hypothetical protein